MNALDVAAPVLVLAPDHPALTRARAAAVGDEAQVLLFGPREAGGWTRAGWVDERHAACP